MHNEFIFYLGLAGALISYVATVTLAVAEHSKVKFGLIFVVAGCLVISAHQWLGFKAEEAKGLAKEAKDLAAHERQEFEKKALSRIDEKVAETLFQTGWIANFLKKTPVEKLGEKLVKVSEAIGGSDERELVDFKKGSPLEWKTYAQWVNNSSDTTTQCLSIYVNAGHRYKVGLLLAYIMTNKDEKQTKAIRDIIEKSGRLWRYLPRVDAFFEKYGNWFVGKKPDGSVKCILFFDGESSQGVPTPIGWADARHFAKELLVYQELYPEPADGQGYVKTKIEKILSQTTQGRTARQELNEMFNSFNTNIIESSDTEEVIKTMMDKRWSRAVVFLEKERYLVNLAKMISLAEK